MTSTLRIKNDYSFLYTKNEELRSLLHDRLRFRPLGYFHNRRYKQRVWDGYTEFYKRETGRFLTGLLPEIKAALHKFGEEYEVVDERTSLPWQYSNIGPQFLNQWLPKTWCDGTSAKPITLEDYQCDFINQAVKHNRGIVFSPTSSGKTFVMVGILKCLPPNTPTLILQNRKALARQNYDEITNWGFQNVGTLWDKSPKPPNVITVANVQSVHKIAKLLPYIKCLIVDEIHDMMSADPKAVYRRLQQCCVRIAMSATPFKFGETDKVQKYEVKGFFGPVLKTTATASGILTTKELQERGRLSDSNCTFYHIDEPQIPHDIYQDAVTHGIAESYHFHQIVSRLVKKCSGRTLILVERLAHGDALSKMIPGAIWVQGKDDEDTRKVVINKLKHSRKDIVAIATQGIFNTGVNVWVHNLINAAGGQAEHQIVQRMGRGLRTADDKGILQYYDFIFRINDYLEKHSHKRVNILQEEGHPVLIKDTIDF